MVVRPNVGYVALAISVLSVAVIAAFVNARSYRQRRPYTRIPAVILILLLGFANIVVIRNYVKTFGAFNTSEFPDGGTTDAGGEAAVSAATPQGQTINIITSKEAATAAAAPAAGAAVPATAS